MHRTGAWVTLFLAAMATGSAIAACNSGTTTSTGGGPLTGGGFGGVAGGSASGGGFGGGACMSATACLPGQACCGQMGTPFASCQAAPCPIDQFCGTSAECLQPGYECRVTDTSQQTPTMVCLPAGEAGAYADGSPDDASDEGPPGDGSPTDGPPPGDGASDGDPVSPDAADAGSSDGA